MDPAQYVHDRLREFHAKPEVRQWRRRIAALFVVLGGIYGAAAGALIAGSAFAAEVVGGMATLMAVICFFPGARFGLRLAAVVGAFSRAEDEAFESAHVSRLFLGLITGTCGAVLGGYLGIVAVLPVIVVLFGAAGGWIVTQIVLQRFVLGRFFGGIAGIGLGTFAAAIAFALCRDRHAALAGLAWGGGIGVAAGLMLFVLFLGILRSLPRVLLPPGEAAAMDRENVIDAAFEEKGPDELPPPDTLKSERFEI